MTDSPPSLGRLAHYRLSDLFGHRNVSFKPKTSGPTLLTGVNGSGKSTILRTISSVGSGQWLDLLPLPFATLELEFESGQTLRVTRDEDAGVLGISLDEEEWELDAHEVSFPDVDDLVGVDGVRRFPGGYEYQGRLFSAQELRQVVGIEALALEEGADWVTEIPGRFSVIYVPDQRLLARGPVPRRPLTSWRMGQVRPGAAEQYSRDLGRLIADGLSQYAARSQTLDREFPQKVVEAMANPGQSDVRQLEELLREVDAERFDLERAGLLEPEDQPVLFDPERLADPNVAPVIRVYAEATMAKFAVLQELKSQLKAFSGFLNEHYQGKQVVVRPGRGFALFVTEGDGDGTERVVGLLSPNYLSSGEQQMLILAYEVLFRTEPGTLILIDEPELSLHVLWLSTLIDDLAAMGRLRNLSFILATHSPTLIGDREELRESLDLDPAAASTVPNT